MNFTITEIANAGILDRERVVIKAINSADVGDYALFRTLSTAKNRISEGNVPNTYWFPDVDVKAGDTIVLYTKKGISSRKSTPSGSTSYFFYWGFETPFWNDTKHLPVLVHTATWKRYNPPGE
jgi:hypothetical protein